MRKQSQSENLHLWEQEKSTWPNHAASRFVVAAGIRWHVQQMGLGPVVLLVHGTGASTHSWRELMPLLARSYSVIAVDLPGHGFSDSLSSKRSSIAGFSEALSGLLRLLGVSPSYCVGHSAGAVVLCRMSLDGYIAPRTIVSINGAFIPLQGAGRRVLLPVARLLASNSIVAHWLARRSSYASVARVIARTGSTLDQKGIELYARLVRNPRHVAGALRMMGSWDLHNFERALPRLAVPLTLIVGDNDKMVPPRQAVSVQEQIAHAVIHRLAGLGHLAHEEKPALLARELSMICAAHS